MKKVALRIYRWIIISLIFQVIVLLFFNNVYLASRGDMSKIKITNLDESRNEAKSTSVNIPENVSNIKVSFDGSYVSYVNGNTLEIMSVKTKNVVKTLSGKGPLSYYNWLPDRNMVIYSFETPVNESVKVRVSTYDVDNEIEHEYNPAITSNITRGSKVADIEFSPKTNVVYVKVQVNDSQAKVFRYNIMDELSYIMSCSLNTVFKIMYLSDNLIYQDSENKITIRNGVDGTRKEVLFDNPVKIIGGDYDDNVYVGELDAEGKVKGIYYGKYNVNPAESWSRTTLHKSVPVDKIVLTKGEKIYSIEDEEHCLYDVKDNKKITYKGNFIYVIDDYVLSQEGNTLILKALK